MSNISPLSRSCHIISSFDTITQYISQLKAMNCILETSEHVEESVRCVFSLSRDLLDLLEDEVKDVSTLISK